MDTVWASKTDENAFMNIFKEDCLHKSKCTIGPDANFFYRIREYCLDRITYLHITSPEYIIVVGCIEDHLSLFGTKFHKENVGIFVVIIDFISIIQATIFATSLDYP